MATAAQIEANRRNAQKSTGPRTEGRQESRDSMPSTTAAGRISWSCRPRSSATMRTSARPGSSASSRAIPPRNS